MSYQNAVMPVLEIPRKNFDDRANRCMAAGLARAINNHLTSVARELDLLRGAGHDVIPQHIDRLLASTNNAADICRQLMQYSERMAFQAAKKQPKSIVANIRRRLEKNPNRTGLTEVSQISQAGKCETSILSGRGITEIWQVSQGLPDVRCDEELIIQAIINVINNAHEAMRSGGILSVCAGGFTCEDAGRAIVGTTRPGEYLCLNVTDNGSGMTPETLRAIFKPFISTKDPNHSLGLGLAATAGIILRHNGFITVETKPGAGTKIAIFLPVDNSSSEKGSPDSNSGIYQDNFATSSPY